MLPLCHAAAAFLHKALKQLNTHVVSDSTLKIINKYMTSTGQMWHPTTPLASATSSAVGRLLQKCCSPAPTVTNSAQVVHMGQWGSSTISMIAASRNFVASLCDNCHSGSALVITNSAKGRSDDGRQAKAMGLEQTLGPCRQPLEARMLPSS